MIALDRHQFLWLDLETTGLDPSSCQVLEWAVVLAADDTRGDMSPVEQFSGVIHCAAPPANTDKFVIDMHTKNGLWSECAASDTTLGESDEFLAGICAELGAKPRSIVLAGSTVAFDQGFVRVHMPKFAAFLSHRCFDVSTLKMADRAWAGQPFAKAEAHRALPDVLESLEHAAAIRRSITRWAQP